MSVKISLLHSYCYILTYLETFKYEFVNCKPSKNKYVWILYCPHYLCTTVHTYIMYITIITIITVRSLFLSAYNLFASHTCTLFCTQLTQTRNFTQDWLNYYWLLPALSGPFIYTRLQSAERSPSRRYMISPSRGLYRESLCICILILSVSHACCWLLIWKVFNVFVYCVHPNSCCIFYVFHTHDHGFCSFSLLFSYERY